MAKAIKLNQPRTRKTTLEILPEDIEIVGKCPFCSRSIEFFFEDENGFEGTDTCGGCKKEIHFKGEVESITRCSLTISPVGATVGGGKLETLESKDLLGSSEDIEVEDNLEDTHADV